MATGSLSGGVCFENSFSAYDAYFSVLPTSSAVDPATGVVSQSSYVLTSGIWNIQQISISPSGVSSLVYSVPASLPIFPACYAPSESFADGVTVGWSFATLMVVVVFVMFGKKLMTHV